MTDEQQLFTFIQAPDGTCWGKWFFPEDVKTPEQARGRHISEFRFGGLYQEIPNPKRKDFVSEEAYYTARDQYLEECDSEDVEMLITDSFVFLRPYPEV